MKRAGVLRRLETDHVVAEHPLADRPSHLQRQQAPVVGIRPGDMDEVLEDRVRVAFADEAGAEVEVVVLEHDDRLGRAVRAGGQDLLGEELVDGDVAAVPGVPRLVR